MPTSYKPDHELAELKKTFPHWEKTKDLVDQLIDIIVNYRQSGHPGGSRSKVYALLATLLSGVMRWDIRHPEKRFGDRFILVGGHAVTLVYCTLAVLNEALRLKYQQTGDARYANPNPREQILYWEDLVNFRERGGLSGHAEMEGKTLFLKFNTGPSGHGAPAAAGEALALKRAGAGEVKVFAFDGEGGFTPGGVQETLSSAYGLELDNLYYVLDWNDFGIDSHPVSSAVYGTPQLWFESHGWKVFGNENGTDWEALTATLLDAAHADNPDHLPRGLWFKTRKGRGYLKYDYASHGAPHAMNSELFWQTKQEFVDKYGATFTNFGGPAPADAAAVKDEFLANLKAVIDVLHQDQVLVDYLADRLVQLGERVPGQISTFTLGSKGNPFKDSRLYNYRSYPEDLFVKPGEKAANRAALAKWGAWVNAFSASEYGRPLFLVASADLADSTNLSGFGAKRGEFPGYGWYKRFGKEDGVILPQEITEFANAGIMSGMVTVNLSEKPAEEFDGFWGACSTYGSFSYLKYGMFGSGSAKEDGIHPGNAVQPVQCSADISPKAAAGKRHKCYYRFFQTVHHIQGRIQVHPRPIPVQWDSIPRHIQVRIFDQRDDVAGVLAQDIGDKSQASGKRDHFLQDVHAPQRDQPVGIRAAQEEVLAVFKNGDTLDECPFIQVDRANFII